MTDHREIIPELIAIRKRWGMTKDDLAEAMGVGLRTLCYWEAGRKVTLRNLVQWADALGYDLHLSLHLRKSR